MTHPFKNKAKSGQDRAKSRYAAGGVVGKLSDAADDAKDDLAGSMSYGADQISNNSNTEKPSTYISRRRMKGDGVFDNIPISRKSGD